MAVHPLVAGIESVRKNWGWFLVLGVVLIVLGLLALGAPFVVTLLTMIWFGWLLLIGAIFEVVSAVQSRQWGGFFLHLAAGLLYGMLGLVMVRHPVEMSVTFTLLLAAYFLASGVFRAIAGVATPLPHRGWIVLSGLINIVLGIMIWNAWPSSALWFIGMCVGIDLIFHGWSWVMFALAAKRMPAVV
jgi:uncharacterized membrane protein HdeD (DUF308 family)